MARSPCFLSSIGRTARPAAFSLLLSAPSPHFYLIDHMLKHKSPLPTISPPENNRSRQSLAHYTNITRMLLQPCVRECRAIQRWLSYSAGYYCLCAPHLLLSQESGPGSWLCPAPHQGGGAGGVVVSEEEETEAGSEGAAENNPLHPVSRLPSPSFSLTARRAAHT